MRNSDINAPTATADSVAGPGPATLRLPNRLRTGPARDVQRFSLHTDEPRRGQKAAARSIDVQEGSRGLGPRGRGGRPRVAVRNLSQGRRERRADIKPQARHVRKRSHQREPRLRANKTRIGHRLGRVAQGEVNAPIIPERDRRAIPTCQRVRHPEHRVRIATRLTNGAARKPRAEMVQGHRSPRGEEEGRADDCATGEVDEGEQHHQGTVQVPHTQRSERW